MLSSLLALSGLVLFAAQACSSTSTNQGKDDDDGGAGAAGDTNTSDEDGSGGASNASLTSSSTGGSSGGSSASSASGGSSGSGGSDGSGGSSGSTTDGASASSSSSGGSSSGGSNSGGSSSVGGSGGSGGETDETAPTIVEISPAEDSDGVERDVVIRVEFSEAISESSADALELTGPDGSVVGSAEVDGATVSFTPEAKLVLLGEYTLSVDTEVEDLAGNPLEQEQVVSFRVRDGQWQPLEYPFGQATARNAYISAANGVGGLVIGGSDSEDPSRAWAGIFEPRTKVWTSAQVIGSDATLNATLRSAAINDSGEASLLWWRSASSYPGGWDRYTPDAGFEDAGAVVDTLSQLTAVNEAGLAMAITQHGTRQAWFTLQDLKSGVVGSLTDLSNSEDRLYALLTVGNDFILVHSRVQTDDSYAIVASRYSTASSSWNSPQTVVSALAAVPSRASAAADESGNLVVAWPEDDGLWARVYSNASAAWGLEVPIAEDVSGASTIDMAGGFAVVAYWKDSQLNAAYYETGTGWLEAGRAAFGEAGSGEEGTVVVDPRGNAMAIVGPAANYSRYVPGLGWHEDSLELEINNYTYAAYAFSDGSVAVVNNEPITDGQVPVVLRFE